MKRLAWVLVFGVAWPPAWCARKINIAQLGEMLRTFVDEKKSDDEIANTLKRLELSEELTRATMNGLLRHAPGPHATEQIYVLEASSAMLPPPAADLPIMDSPNPAAQAAILAKAENYVTETYDRLPALTAIKSTLRFQDNTEAVAASSGITGSARDAATNNGLSNSAEYIHYVNSTESRVASERGAERPPEGKDKTPWGANKMIVLKEPDPSLGQVFREAQSAGEMRWLRWEIVDGKRTAVFSFEVPKKKAKLGLNVCCFPNVNQTGVATFYTSTTAAALAGDNAAGGGGGGVTGNFQTNTEWHNFRTEVAYHGEVFVDPDSGIVLRMITMAELRPSDVVHRVDTRIDYGPVHLDDRDLILPVKTIVDTEVVPNGDSGHGGYSTRRTLFTTEYKDYQPALETR